MTRQISTRKFAGEVDTHFIERFYLASFARTNLGTKCDFGRTDKNGVKWDACRLYTTEGLAFNVNQCIDVNVS